MERSFLTALFALFACACVAACGGGASAPTPSSPHGAYGQGLVGTFTVDAAGAQPTFGPAGAVTAGSLSLGAPVTGTGTMVTYTVSASAPDGLPPLESTHKSGAQGLTRVLPQDLVHTGEWFLSLTPSADISFSSTPSLRLTLGGSLPGSFLLAWYDPALAAWTEPWGGVASTSGSTITFGSSDSPVSMKANQTYYIAFYTSVGTPSPSPTPTPTPNEQNYIENGTFATGTLAPWYRCYAPRIPTAQAAAGPIDASPAPVNPGSSPNPGPTPVTDDPSSDDVSIQQTTPSLVLPPSGDLNFARTGYDNSGIAPYISLPGEAPYGEGSVRGNVGICQDVTIPSDPAVLSFYLYEGGNDQFNKQDDEADIYPLGSFSSSTDGATAGANTAPSTVLYAQNNCYDNQQYNQVYLAPPWGTGTHSATATSREAACPYYPGGIVPDGGNDSWLGAPGGGTVSLGGIWYQKNITITGYAGQTVTLFLGVSSATDGNSPGTTTGVGEYIYAFYDDIALQGFGAPPTPAGTLTANPASLDLLQPGPASFTVTEPGYRGAFTVTSSDTSRVTVISPVVATSDTTTIQLNVPPTAQGGAVSVRVIDATAQSVTVPINLTITNATVQGVH